MPEADKTILRQLAAQVAEIAALPVHQQTIANWTALNDLRPVKPMVLVTEPPWHELNVNDELTLQTTTSLPVASRRACGGRCTNGATSPATWWSRTWSTASSPSAIPASASRKKWTSSAPTRPAVSSRVNFTRRLIVRPTSKRSNFRRSATTRRPPERKFEQLNEIFSGVLRVEKRGWIWGGIVSWDELIRWWGVQKAMLDLVLRPELLHLALERLTEANFQRLRQLEAQGLLALNTNWLAGSGGYAYTDELPQPDYNPAHVRPIDMWGSAASQIFSRSRRYAREFALRYERPWLEQLASATMAAASRCITKSASCAASRTCARSP